MNHVNHMNHVNFMKNERLAGDEEIIIIQSLKKFGVEKNNKVQKKAECRQTGFVIHFTEVCNKKKTMLQKRKRLFLKV